MNEQPSGIMPFSWGWSIDRLSECWVNGPGVTMFDPFTFVAVGPQERARLLGEMLNNAFRAGYEAAKKETAK